MIIPSSILAVLYIALLLFRSTLARGYAKSLPPPDNEQLPPGALTIVQPILSGDPLLEETLQANLSTLPDQAFLWLVDLDDTEGLRIVERLRGSHPQVEVLVCTPCPDRINPKVWKLQQASRRLRTPFFCVVDDDTMLPRATARTLMSRAATHTITTGLPCYLDAGTIASGLLAQFVNNNAAFTYLGTSRLIRPFTLNGMGYVLRWESLEEIDHFGPIQHELTDDHALASLVLQKEGSIFQSPSPLIVRSSVRNLEHYVQLMHRWHVFTLLLLKSRPARERGLIVGLHGLPPFILWALCICVVAAASPITLGLLALVVGVRRQVLIHTHRRFYGRRLHRLFLSVVSELLQPFHLLHALVHRTIRWRIRRYRVRDTNDYAAV